MTPPESLIQAQQSFGGIDWWKWLGSLMCSVSMGEPSGMPASRA